MNISKLFRVILVLLTALLVFSAVACTDDKPDDGKTDASTADSGESSNTDTNDIASDTATPVETGPNGETLYDAPIYTADYLRGDSQLRYYKITAQISDETTYEFLTRVPAVDHDNLQSDMHAQTDTINALALAKPDVNWYIYLSTELADTEMANDIFPLESTHDLINEFFDRLDPVISHGSVQLNSVQDRVDKYYLSDHHWNANGYLDAYHDIVAMLQAKYPDITCNEPVQYYDFPEIVWYGSFANATSLRSIKDSFGFFDFELPEHQLTIESGVSYSAKKTREEQKAIYLAGDYNKDDSYGHYIYFYRIAKEINYTGNNTGRNLLLVGDSYSPPLMEILAQYFDNTYVRYLDSNKALKDIDYTDFVEKNGITDVIVVEMSSRLALNLYSVDIDGILLK